MHRISRTVLGGLSIPLPPLPEQKAIAEWLDERTGRIDRIIATREKQIELLEEMKSAVISRAVTKGLNPDAKMKDSRIEWIGNVPEHWEVAPFKRAVTINNGRDYKDVQAEDGYPVIGSGGQFAYATDYLYDGEALLLGRKGTIDRPLYVNEKFWTVDTMFYALPLKGNFCKYLYYLSSTFPFDRYATSTALPSMTQTDLGGHLVALPPLSEQQEIVSYLDRETEKIEKRIGRLRRQIELLKEYKATLISEAVTGKIKVKCEN